VAFLFQDASLLNIAKDPTHELANTEHAMRHTATDRCLIFIFVELKDQ
jgi:hypothetical protein